MDSIQIGIKNKIENFLKNCSPGEGDATVINSVNNLFMRIGVLSRLTSMVEVLRSRNLGGNDETKNKISDEACDYFARNIMSEIAEMMEDAAAWYGVVKILMTRRQKVYESNDPLSTLTTLSIAKAFYIIEQVAKRTVDIFNDWPELSKKHGKLSQTDWESDDLLNDVIEEVLKNDTTTIH